MKVKRLERTLIVVTELVSQESHKRWSNEDTEREDSIDERHIQVTDSDILHVDGEVGEDGIRRA